MINSSRSKSGRRRHFALIVFVLSITFVASAQVKNPRCPTPEGPVLERTACDPNFDFSINRIDRVLMSVLSDTAVPGGVSLLYGNDGENSYHFNIASRSLKDILDSIKVADSRYHWNEDRGVINLSPLDDYPLLSTRLEKFHVVDESKAWLMAKLIASPEFQKALMANELSSPRIFSGGGISSTSPPPKYSIQLQNVTVRDVLNEIVRLNGRSTWAYHEFPSQDGRSKRHYRLYFLGDRF